MQHLSTAFLIVALVIVVNRGHGVKAFEYVDDDDLIAVESRNRPAVVEGLRNKTVLLNDTDISRPPAVVTESSKTKQINLNKTSESFYPNNTQREYEQRPPNKPPIPPPDKNGKPKYVEIQRPYRQVTHKNPPRQYTYSRPQKTIYRIIPVTYRRPQYHKSPPKQSVLYAASSQNKPVIQKSPIKYSQQMQIINGIPTEVEKPPKWYNNTKHESIKPETIKSEFTNKTNSTKTNPPKSYPPRNNSSTTTTVPFTTTKYLRTKRIWPKRILDKLNANSTTTETANTEDATFEFEPPTKLNETDLQSSAATHRFVKHPNKTIYLVSTVVPSKIYRRITRAPNSRPTPQKTPPFGNGTNGEPNEWVPILPSHFSQVRKLSSKPIKASRRSDQFFLDTPLEDQEANVRVSNKQTKVSRRSGYGMFFLPRPNDQTAEASYNSFQKQSVYAEPQNKQQMSYIEPSQSKQQIVYIDPHSKQQMAYIEPINYKSYGEASTQTAPIGAAASNDSPLIARKRMILFRKKKRPAGLNNPYLLSGYSNNHSPVTHTPAPYVTTDLQTAASHVRSKVITKIKHHHHHHHHRYIKTVEKQIKVPFKVEVPKPYPVPFEKKVPYAVETIKYIDKPVPYPVHVEKRVPYPVEVKVPVPVKVIQKEYVPKPYPVVQHVPIYKQVEVKVPQPYAVQVEKKVPYPVQVPVPYEKQVAYPVHVDKPYPVPVKVLVPQPYPVETRVPYPVEVKVKEPYEVIKHIPIRIPFPQPIPIKVPQPYPVETRIPYPVEVERKVPIPVEIGVPKKIYAQKPYSFEKQVSSPIKFPFPIRIPVKAPSNYPIQVPIIIQQSYPLTEEDFNDIESGTNLPGTVTIHGNTAYNGFQSRSDKPEYQEEETTTSAPSTTSSSTTTATEDIKTDATTSS